MPGSRTLSPAPPCDQAPVPAAPWNSAGGVFRRPPPLPSRNERLELREGERREQREGGGAWL